MSDEGFECFGVQVEFPAQTDDDLILKRFGDPEMIANMQKVFFGEDPNPLGHSYAGLIRGPGGRNDLQDIIELLHDEPWSKRAVLTLCGNGNGKVPCINAIQFLVRDGAVQAVYFARGQDAFRKFYADALCLTAIVQRVADHLHLPSGNVTGFIGSCHLYHRDVEQIQKMLEVARKEMPEEVNPSPRPSPLARREGESSTANNFDGRFQGARANAR